MEKVLIRYKGYGSSQFDGKEYLKSVSKLKRHNSRKGHLKINEQVTIKTLTVDN